MQVQYQHNIKSKRLSIGLSVKEFADALGLGRNGDAIVRQWETGELVPNDDQYEKIMNFASIVPFPNRGDKFTFIDLFAGIGGIRIPFGEYGGKCVFSSEWDKHAQQTYRINFGETPSGNIQEHFRVLYKD